jgi:hypothetical protein
MADNVAVTEGSGKTIATDDVGGRQHQLVKPKFGANNTVTDISTGAGAVDAGTQRTTSASNDPAVTALQIMDDWDESDRAKVNLIAGQAGITGGAGAAASNTPRVTLASDDPLVADVDKLSKGDFETVAASQTDQVLGPTGASGDYLGGVLIVPATTSPGAVSIKDGAGSAITIFTGGADSVSNLVPFMVPLGIRSASGAWSVTTGGNVTAIGVGDFT